MLFVFIKSNNINIYIVNIFKGVKSSDRKMFCIIFIKMTE